MPVSQGIEPCWYVAAASDYRESGVHLFTEAAARSHATDLRNEDPLDPVTVSHLPAPCWTVTCDGDCGDVLEDGEQDWTLHFPSQIEAEKYAAACGWSVTDLGVFCFDDETPAEAVPLVTEQVHGQGAMFSNTPCTTPTAHRADECNGYHLDASDV